MRETTAEKASRLVPRSRRRPLKLARFRVSGVNLVRISSP